LKKEWLSPFINFMSHFNFTVDTYPKSHGSLDSWRLSEWLHLPEAEQEQAYRGLERFCLSLAEQSEARQSYDNLMRLGSGWEWSVFAKDELRVVKVPAGIFAEVNDPTYLVNAEWAYATVSRFLPDGMVAETRFYRDGEVNVIEQARLSGTDMQVIEIAGSSDWLLERLLLLFEAVGQMIEELHWLPDVWLDSDERGLVLRNVMIDESKNQFCLVDFTSYLDPARMYPMLCERHCRLHGAKVKELIEQVKNELASRSRSVE
jgi:hypothetical protein